ncbi:MAG: T9SS C-terminal target domain-containing protein [Flavobacteriia bacterium]|nr:T9SS C-terminal target domain-containing protein [Flavobacteriia bacterium]
MANANFVLATVNLNYLAYLGYTANFGMVTIPANQTGNLPINCGGGAGNACANLWTTVTPWIGYYQNSIAYIKLNWGNYGPSSSGNYTLTFSFPAGVTVNTASINTPGYTIAGNTITWNLTNAWNGYSMNDVITFNVPGGILNGANHYFISTIIPTGNVQDCNLQNNNGSLLQIVGNSYDPNDKNVQRPNFYENNILYANDEIEVGTEDVLTYTIRFQNTGNAPAQNIVVVDTLDAQLDWSTLDVIYRSHNLQVVNMGNGIMHFEFNDIWLPDSSSNEPESHGEFIYQIKENIGNSIGSEITNTAHIFFDWNPAIVTNTTYNVNIATEGVDELSQKIKVYPNPASNLLNVHIQEAFNYEILDLNGRSIQKGSGDAMGQISLENISVGTYVLRLNVGGTSYMSKLIKR